LARVRAAAGIFSILVMAPMFPAMAMGAQPGDAQALVNVRHNGRVRDMEFDEGRGFLFTSGEDGTVRIWDLSSGRLFQVIRIGHLPVAMLAVNPVLPQVAVLETDGVRYFSISEWDWESGDRIFSSSVQEQPIFLRYSDAGGYLALGISQWQGLRILRSSDGEPVSFHPEGFGIVSFAQIPADETSLITYQPGGKISYWNLKTGNLEREVKSVAALGQIRVSGDGRILGSNGKEIVLVNLSTGSPEARTALSGAISMDLSGDGGEFSAISGSPSSPSLSRWKLSGSTLSQAAAPVIPPGVYLLRYAADRLLAAGDEGSAYVLEPGGPEPVGRGAVAEVTGFSAGGGVFALASDRWIWIFRCASAALDISQPRVVVNPIGGPSGLSFLPDGRLVVWSKKEEKGFYGFLDMGGVFTPGFGGFTGPLLQLFPQDGRIVSLERSGMVRLIDIQDSTLRFSAWLPGINRIALGPGKMLFGAKSAAGVGDSSLISLDMGTGEIAPLASRSVYTYELLHDTSRGVLYSIGVGSDGGTDLLVNEGTKLDTQTLMRHFDSSDLFASLALDPSTGILYTSLGFDIISAWNGKTATELPPTRSTPRKLASNEGLLFALNSDSSFAILETASERELADISLFPDGGWCVLFPDGRFAASNDLVEIRKDGALVSDKSPYMVALPP
jgi:WD40 repeat protein